MSCSKYFAFIHFFLFVTLLYFFRRKTQKGVVRSGGEVPEGTGDYGGSVRGGAGRRAEPPGRRAAKREGGEERPTGPPPAARETGGRDCNGNKKFGGKPKKTSR